MMIHSIDKILLSYCVRPREWMTVTKYECNSKTRSHARRELPLLLRMNKTLKNGTNIIARHHDAATLCLSVCASG